MHQKHSHPSTDSICPFQLLIAPWEKSKAWKMSSCGKKWELNWGKLEVSESTWATYVLCGSKGIDKNLFAILNWSPSSCITLFGFKDVQILEFRSSCRSGSLAEADKKAATVEAVMRMMKEATWAESSYGGVSYAYSGTVKRRFCASRCLAPDTWLSLMFGGVWAIHIWTNWTSLLCICSSRMYDGSPKLRPMESTSDHGSEARIYDSSSAMLARGLTRCSS